MLNQDVRGSHLGWWAGSSDIILKEDHLRTIPPKFGIDWCSSFGEEDFLRNHPPPFFSSPGPKATKLLTQLEPNWWNGHKGVLFQYCV